MTGKPHDVLATREARTQLSTLLERFRREGANAEPVVIGARRRPEAVVLSYERYLQLAGGRQRVADALDRQAREAGERLDADEATAVADRERHVLRRERSVNAWERMGRELRDRADRWQHPPAEPAGDEAALALDELAEAFRTAMIASPGGKAARRGSE